MNRKPSPWRITGYLALTAVFVSCAFGFDIDSGAFFWLAIAYAVLCPVLLGVEFGLYRADRRKP